MSGTIFRTGDFAPPEHEFRAEFRETNFGRPNFQERKRHININKFFRWLPGRGGGLPTWWGGGVLSCFVHAPFRTFHVSTFQLRHVRLRKFSVAVWRGSEGIGVLLLCHVETPGNQWTGAQFGGASLAHAKTRKQWKHAHLFKGFSKKIVDRWTFSKARVGVFYRAGDRRSLWNYRIL